MRRDAFLKSIARLPPAALPLLAAGRHAGANMKMMIPANPGGGWDTTGRALGKTMRRPASGVGAPTTTRAAPPGAIGPSRQFVNGSKGGPNALMVMGAVDAGGIITGRRRCR